MGVEERPFRVTDEGSKERSQFHRETRQCRELSELFRTVCYDMFNALM